MRHFIFPPTNNFIEALEERIDLEKAKLFKEKDVLNYVKRK
ncbi:DUF2972 domain-containing protein [Campylobacter jejuni]|nr:DUF2972 domain-containing protein [Campylobacter jejuni]